MRILILSAFVFLCNAAGAQINLVKNGGFEQRDTCPWGYDQIKIAKYWSCIDTGFIPYLPYVGDSDCSSEYINTCGVPYGTASAPHNPHFYQYPHGGNGMVASMMYSDQTVTSHPLYLRDYTQGRLSANLTSGQSYCITFYVVNSSAASIAVNKIGAYLDDGSIDTVSFCGLPHPACVPQVYTSAIISDTLNWIKIQGSFIANGTERFITIGNFFDSAHTEKITPVPSNNYGYYLVDDVSVIATGSHAYAGPDVTIMSGITAAIGATSNGDGMPCYWYIYGSSTPIDSGGTILVHPTDTTTYVVSMDLCGVITYDTVRVNVIPCTSSPTASFTDTGSHIVGFTYTGSITPAIDSMRWYFGDGNTSTMTNPVHTYTTAGTYSVCVTVYAGCGRDTFCSDVIVNCTNPVAAFTDSGSLTIGFTYTGSTTPAIDSMRWHFGDGGTSTAINPIHTYSTAGSYHVCVAAYAGCGRDTICRDVAATCTPPTASFTDTGNSTVGFTYTGSLSYVDSMRWYFGDGATSTLTNPFHSYTTPGTYSVCVTIFSDCSNDTFCSSVVIPPCTTPPIASFTDTGSHIINFTYTGTLYSIDSVVWDFGDGALAYGIAPIHTYTASGAYTVCVTAYTSCGSDSSCHTVVVSTTGVSGFSLNSIQIYPNPVKDELHIAGVPQNTSYRLLNVSGECVMQGDLKTGSSCISTQQMSGGVHILELISAEGLRNMIRILKE